MTPNKTTDNGGHNLEYNSVQLGSEWNNTTHENKIGLQTTEAKLQNNFIKKTSNRGYDH